MILGLGFFWEGEGWGFFCFIFWLFFCLREGGLFVGLVSGFGFGFFPRQFYLLQEVLGHFSQAHAVILGGVQYRDKSWTLMIPVGHLRILCSSMVLIQKKTKTVREVCSAFHTVKCICWGFFSP